MLFSIHLDIEPKKIVNTKLKEWSSLDEQPLTKIITRPPPPVRPQIPIEVPNETIIEDEDLLTRGVRRLKH